jgi:hypothetical protein
MDIGTDNEDYEYCNIDISIWIYCN